MRDDNAMPSAGIRCSSHLAATKASPATVLLLLAAGRSRRLGRPKAAVTRGGCPLLVHQLRMARAAGITRACVVLGAGAQRLAALLGPGERNRLGFSELRVVRVQRWRGGMGESLREGLGNLPPDWRQVLILLVDQVGIRAPDLRRLPLRGRTCGAVWAATPPDRRQPQVPVMLPRTMTRAARSQLRGDRGLAPWLRRLPEKELKLVALDGLERDLDTPADAMAWRLQLRGR